MSLNFPQAVVSSCYTCYSSHHCTTALTGIACIITGLFLEKVVSPLIENKTPNLALFCKVIGGLGLTASGGLAFTTLFLSR